jgi:hypothetical protein
MRLGSRRESFVFGVHARLDAADAMKLRLLLANPALFGRPVNGHEPRRPQQLARRVETTSFSYDL